ncbi:MAG: hypothetical protein K6F28_03045 [Lachnospiraceae bacterium]|nr:hypothetical protein [Lachnospiraceae bacterium]
MTDKIGKRQIHTSGCGFPMGAVKMAEGVQFSVALPYRNTLELFIFNDQGKVIDHVNMPDHALASGVCSCLIHGKLPDGFSYAYEADGIKVCDPFMKNSTAARKFGDAEGTLDNAKLYEAEFDWGDDRPLCLPYNSIIAYQVHVRGFTNHTSSRVRHKGKFSGLTEKIPYLMDLGVNQVVLMPSYEFDEIIRPQKALSMDRIDYKALPGKKEEYKINFWGFTEGCYYMPKASYSDGDPVREFKTMVKDLHAAGIEVIMRMYFPDTVNRAYIPDILKFWAYEYHVDGFFVMGDDLPMDIIAADMFLRDRKIYNIFFDKDAVTRRKYGYNHNMAFVNPDFMNVCRKYLKSDENQLSDFLYRQRLNPADVHTVNYITDYYGFTLKDLVTFDYKHNEDNKEDNRDGENFNYSWNCGVEGVSRKRSVISLRMKQMKNALVFLLLSQGVPMICAGDEFANTQMGNNNTYCQDNEIGWVVWKTSKHSQEIYDFTKMLISLRREHPILHPEREFRLMDYASCGFPDLSYHGDMAWNPRFENHLRHIGIMICGKYARLTRIKEDDFFYIAYNMHWEDHTFALPKLPKGLAWTVCFATCEKGAAAVIHDTLKENEGSVTVPDRCICVLRSGEQTDDKKSDLKADDITDKI